ncbi:hypothetical protein KR222_005633, partial [Zaprionus bogoriensis]
QQQQQQQQQQHKEDEAEAEAALSSSSSDPEEDELNLSTDDAPARKILHASRHETMPMLNQGLAQSLSHSHSWQSFPSCALTVALPLYVANRTTPILDPCLKRAVVHDEWMRQLSVYRRYYQRQTAQQKQRERKQQERIYNAHLYDVAESIATQENVYFRDSYDYYYSGGNLCLMPHGTDATETLALHVSGPRLQQLHISHVGAEAELWQPLHSASLEHMSSELFELQPISSFRLNHGQMFVARLLNDVLIYELRKAAAEEEEEQQEEEQHTPRYELHCQSKYSSEAGHFVSVAQSLSSAQTLAVACEDRSVRFMDLVTQQDISKHDVHILKGVDKGSTWAQLRPWQQNCFNYACQSVLLTIDARCANEAINPCFASSVYSRNCESLSCMARSANPHLLYVASNHKLHCLDMRCLGRKLSDRAVVTWTHQMSVSPTFMDSIVHAGSEFVALGSALPDDLRICELQGALAPALSAMCSPVLPYAPVQLSEALLEARLHGCVDIYADLGERIRCSTTGLRFHRLEQASDNAFAQLLTANSAGDVYCQRVTLRHEQETQQEQRTGVHTHQAIDYYAQLVRAHVKRTLRCTELQAMPLMRELMDKSGSGEQEKPLIVEDVQIDWGFADSDSESEVATSSQEQPTGSKKTKPKKQKKTPKKTAPTPASTKSVERKKRKGINRGPWQKSAHYLSRFTDVISTRMLSIWDIEEFDLTRDVEIDMIDEKLKQEKQEQQHDDRTASWLQQLQRPEQPAEDLEPKPELVPGTNLPVRFEAVHAAYREQISETIGMAAGVGAKRPKIELDETLDGDITFGRQACSTLKPNEFTIIEHDWSASQQARNTTPAKRRKTKHVMGF